MVYEDLHWIDPSSRELLDMMVERVARLPVLLLVTFRPEFQPPWTGQAHVTTLNLSRLGRREGMALVGSVAGKGVLSDAMVEEIIKRTDGIPLFVEELTKAVVEAGASDEDIVSLNEAPLSAAAVPATLHASLMTRLDRLGPVAKEVAQVGAAIGREFSYEVLAPIARKSDGELQTALSRLTEAGLVFCRGAPPQASFLFKHALVRDVAYGSLLRGQRKQLHARIFTTLEVQFSEMADQQPEILAHHCTEAELNEEAVTYWTRAARQSMERHAMIEATAQARKGLAVLMRLPDGPTRWRQELELTSVLAGSLNASIGASAPETGEVYVRARKLCMRLGETAALVPVLSGLAFHHAQRCELAAIREIGQELLRLGDEEKDISCQMHGHRVMGSCLYWLGEFLPARKHLEQALDLYVPQAHKSMIPVIGFDVRGASLSNLSYTLLILGYPHQARSRSLEALRWPRDLNYPHVLAHALTMASFYNLACGNVGTAQGAVQELLALALEQGFRVWGAYAKINQGLVLAQRGDRSQGLALAREGLVEKAATGSALWRPFELGFMARACAGMGQVDEALHLLDDALQIAETTGERHFDAELHRFKGECLAARCQTEAEASFQMAVEVAQQQDARMWELRASMSLARLWRGQGKHTEAYKLLGPIFGWFTEGFDTPDLKEAKALLDLLK
jgi:predicted ATPase